MTTATEQLISILQAAGFGEAHATTLDGAVWQHMYTSAAHDLCVLFDDADCVFVAVASTGNAVDGLDGVAAPDVVAYVVCLSSNAVRVSANRAARRAGKAVHGCRAVRVRAVLGASALLRGLLGGVDFERRKEYRCFV